MSNATEVAVDEVTGVGKSTAVKLHSANIKTAEQLSKALPEQLVPLGIPKGTATNLIKNAIEILSSVNKTAATAITTASAAITLQRPVTPLEYTEEDVENAGKVGMDIEEYLQLSPSGRARVVRLARMQVNVLPEDGDDDFAQDTNLGDFKARDFIRKQNQKKQEERRLQKISQSAAVSKFVEEEVHGHELKDEPVNVIGERIARGESTEEKLVTDEIYIRKPKRKKTSKRGSDIVQQIVDNILD